MSQESNGNDVSPKSPAPKAGQDLSPEIVSVIAREPSDLVRCVRVFGDYYRCNWWALSAGADQKPADQCGVLSTRHVRKSSFLNVTLNMGKLTIHELSS